MTFLLDTDTCSAHMRRPAQLAHRLVQHTGGLAIPSFVLAELYAGAYKHPNPPSLLPLIASVALVHNLTMVTHNTKDYQNIPGLRLDDWLPP